MKEKYTHKKLEELGEKVIDWCLNEFGLSKHYNDYPYMEIDMVEDCMCGEFIGYNNEIIICPTAIDTIDEFIETSNFSASYQNHTFVISDEGSPDQSDPTFLS